MTASDVSGPYYCPENPEGGHEPNTIIAPALTTDGEYWWLDVECKYCGRLGCIAHGQVGASPVDW